MARRVTVAIVEACADLFTGAELLAYKKAAAQALLEDKPRVVMTNSNMRDGGYGGQFVEGSPEFVMELCKRAIEWQANEAAGDPQSLANQSMSHADFSRRQVGW